MTRTTRRTAQLRRAGVFVLLAALGGAGLQWGAPGAQATEPLHWTSSADILTRAASWVDQGVPYSQNAQAADLLGKKYRTDCSGFISMAWGLGRSLTTQSLPSVSTALGPVGDYTRLRAGDMLDTISNRHAVLFVGWANAERTTAMVMEEPHTGTVARMDSTYYTTALLTAEGFVAYRFDHVRTPVSMDWTGDGHPDVIAHRAGDGSLWVYPGPVGALAKPRRLATGLEDTTAIVELADVDQSGAPALVMRRQDGSLWAALRSTKGGLRKPHRVTAAGISYDAIAPAGALDRSGLLAQTADGTVWLLPGDGAGGFRASRVLAAGWPAGETVVSAGAVGKDGFPALYGRGTDGTIWLHLGDSRGGWAAETPVVSAEVAAGVPGAADGADTASSLTGRLKVDRLVTAVSSSTVSAVGGTGAVLVRRSDGSLWLLAPDGHGGLAAPVRQAGHWLGYDFVV